MKVKLYNWDIEIKETSKLEIEANDGKNSWGSITYADKLIVLRKDLDIDIKRQTLIHELTHGVIVYMGYGKMNIENICDFMGAHLDVIYDIVERYFE